MGTARYGYPYGYGPHYVPERYGYVKIDTHHQDKDAAVYVDGGYAAPVKKAKKFALRPGTHDIELRNSDNRTIFLSGAHRRADRQNHQGGCAQLIFRAEIAERIARSG